MRRRFWPLLLLVVGLLAGCEDTLRGKLTDAQSNEMLATLAQYRISATRALDNDGSWHVSVGPTQRDLAVEILKTYEMPQPSHPNMSEVFPKEGFMSSPVEERARYQFGLAQELERTIERMEGVVLARVHVAMPGREFLKDANDKPASASVFIKYRSDMSLAGREGDIRQLVMNSIGEGPADNVSVLMMPVTPMFVSPSSRLEAGWMGLLYRSKDRSNVLMLVGLPWLMVFLWLALRLAATERVRKLLQRMRRKSADDTLAGASYYRQAAAGGPRSPTPATAPPRT